jgi:hypothetical protein
MAGALDQFNTPKKPKLADILTQSTMQTEGLIPGQTPLRMPDNKKHAFKNTVQGVPLDWGAHAKAPKERQNFYFVQPGSEQKVIKKQWQNYFNKPGNYGLTDESTISDVIKKFDQERPINKLKILEKNNIDIKMKIKDVRNAYDLSFLNQIMNQGTA